MSFNRIAVVRMSDIVTAIDKEYSYYIPSELEGTIQKGVRVAVEFGRANRQTVGIVTDVLDKLNGKQRKLKSIMLQIDLHPVLTGENYAIIDYLVNNTFCTYYDAVRLVISHLEQVKISCSYKLCSQELADVQLTLEQQRIVQIIEDVKTKKQLDELMGVRDVLKIPEFKSMLRSNLIIPIYSIVEKKTMKSSRYVYLVEFPTRTNDNQKRVIELLQDGQRVLYDELCYNASVSKSVVDNLVKKEILAYDDGYFVQSTVKDVTSSLVQSYNTVELSDEQQRVFDGVNELEGCQTALLYGVTGSGKTQVYIKLIEQQLKNNKTAMLLVPEISLTPQTVDKFKRVFGDSVAVIHSALTTTQKKEQYNNIKQGISKIVIGTRSAVFSPLSDIGIIIIDEQSEPSYKSETTPRYHAIEIAMLRCRQNNCTLLMGSATPSINSYYFALSGRYKLFKLEQRYSAILPQVYIIDMEQETKQGNYNELSDVLAQQIIQTYNNGEQSMLFINRRGYNSFAYCMDCGEHIICQNCDVKMTYHKANDSLICHHCGETIRDVPKCRFCDSAYIRLGGLGTQKIQEELQRLIPNAKIVRMDADTTHSRDVYEKQFEKFANGEYNIMVGTQMIAKGLDFPNVTLAGIINSDGGLYSGDYRAVERVFSLVTQVIGRSGRRSKQGVAYLQTTQTDNSTINYAANQNYEMFYADEIEARKQLRLPPYCDMVEFCIISKEQPKGEQAANYAVQQLRLLSQNKTNIAMQVFGATTFTVHKVNNKYRFRVIIKCKYNKEFKNLLKSLLESMYNHNKSVDCYVDRIN